MQWFETEQQLIERTLQLDADDVGAAMRSFANTVTHALVKGDLPGVTRLALEHGRKLIGRKTSPPAPRARCTATTLHRDHAAP